MFKLCKQRIKRSFSGIEGISKTDIINTYHTISELLWKNREIPFCYNPEEDLLMHEESNVLFVVDSSDCVVYYAKER